ncbi:MAG: glutamate racemase [Elusimicrobiota bacterium]
MDGRPIGIFDSGFGGLTVMAEIRKLLPREDLIYFGDTAHVPYGSKSKEVVTGYSADIAKFLLSKKVKMIVVACNTASAFALPALKAKLKVPVIGVIEPGAKAALSVTLKRKIGVIGTEGTVKSSSYTKALKRLDPRIRIFAVACPLFVPLVEEGWLKHPMTYRVAKEYITPLVRKGVDTIVLGCTHYPLIKSVIKKTAGKSVSLIDSAAATAVEVAGTLKNLGIESQRSKGGKCIFYVSDAPAKFKLLGRKFMGQVITRINKVAMR